MKHFTAILLGAWFCLVAMLAHAQANPPAERTTPTPPSGQAGAPDDPVKLLTSIASILSLKTTPIKPPSDTSPRSAPLTFKTDGQFILPSKLAEAAAKTPEDRQRRQSIYESVLSAYEKTAQGAGWEKHDFAGAIAMFLGAQYEAATQRALQLDSMFALRRQFAERALANSSYAKLSDRDKQQLYEALVISAGVTQISYSQAIKRRDQQLMRRVTDQARQRLEKTLQVPLERIAITEAGLQLRD